MVESGRQLVMIDHSEEFHRRTLELRIFPGSGQLVLGRWQDHLGSMRNHFDIVLSDLTSGNLTYEERPRFLKDIREALVEGGLFVDKVLTMEATPLTRRHMELTYQKRAMNLLTVNDFTNDIFFRSWLVAGLEQIHRDDILASAVSEWGTNPRLSNLLNQAAEMIPERAVWSYGRPWNQLREEYSANFATRVDWLNDVRSCPFYRSLRVLILENRSL